MLQSSLTGSVSPCSGSVTCRAKKASGKRKAKSSGGARGGFGKACLLSPALSALVGAETMVRSQVVKCLWDYIKQHGLQVSPQSFCGPHAAHLCTTTPPSLYARVQHEECLGVRACVHMHIGA